MLIEETVTYLEMTAGGDCCRAASSRSLGTGAGGAGQAGPSGSVGAAPPLCPDRSAAQLAEPPDLVGCAVDAAPGPPAGARLDRPGGRGDRRAGGA